jgi:hypothetical protein
MYSLTDYIFIVDFKFKYVEVRKYGPYAIASLKLVKASFLI